MSSMVVKVGDGNEQKKTKKRRGGLQARPAHTTSSAFFSTTALVSE
jgi:hypothetical protein